MKLKITIKAPSPSHTLLLQAGQTQFPQLALECLTPLSLWPSIGLSLAYQCLSVWNPKLDIIHYAKRDLANANWKGITISLQLLAALLLMQPSKWLAFITSRAHCWFVFKNFTPDPALQSCSHSSQTPPYRALCLSNGKYLAFVLLSFMKFLSPRKDVQCYTGFIWYLTDEAGSNSFRRTYWPVLGWKAAGNCKWLSHWAKCGKYQWKERIQS